MVGPEAFEEVRYLAHLRQLDALDLIPRWPQNSPTPSADRAGVCSTPYRTEDADTVVVALGSVLGTIKDAVDARRDAGERVGVVGITSFRPFPSDAVRRRSPAPDGSWSSRRRSASASAGCSRPM